MTKEQRTEAINLSFDGMTTAQDIMEATTDEHDRKIAKALYEAFWALWMLLIEDRRTENRPTAKTGPATEAVKQT